MIEAELEIKPILSLEGIPQEEVEYRFFMRRGGDPSDYLYVTSEEDMNRDPNSQVFKSHKFNFKDYNNFVDGINRVIESIQNHEKVVQFYTTRGGWD